MRLQKQRDNLNGESRAFLLELLAVIERYNLDLSLPGGCTGLYNLKHENYDNFIEVLPEDYDPYCFVKDNPDLSIILKLMLGIEMPNQE